MKTFKEFISEANNKHGIPDDEYVKWREARSKGEGPVRMTLNDIEYEMRGKGYKKDGTKKWGVSTSSSREESRLKRIKAEKEAVKAAKLADPNYKSPIKKLFKFIDYKCK